MSTEGDIIRELRQAGFKVMNRRQWGSRHLRTYQTRRTTRRFVGAADHLFGHITVTHDTGNAAADMRQVEDIGWKRFGTGASYNYCLHRSTKTILIGMPHDAAGAHTLNDKNIAGFPDNLNYWGHAIAFIGVPGDPFTQWCVNAAAAIEAAEKKHNACKNGANWYPHSKFAWKDCPCDPFRNKLGRIATRAKSVLGEGPTTEEDWFDMATEKQLEEVVARVVDAKMDDIAWHVWAKEIGGGDNRRAARMHELWSSNASRASLTVLQKVLAIVRGFRDNGVTLTDEQEQALADADAEITAAQVANHLDAKTELTVKES